MPGPGDASPRAARGGAAARRAVLREPEGLGSPIEAIGARIWTAIVERKLRPGTRLKEEALAEIFGVSRARIRQALAKLERDGLVTIVPNRGACVAEPTPEEARDVFFVRRLLEGRLVAELAARLGPADLARLGAHVEAERAAHRRADLPAIVHLSGGFHLALAGLAGSRLLPEILRDLVSRTSLITAMHQPKMLHSCGPDEHGAILARLAARDGAGATALMDDHLEHLEAQLELAAAATPTGDLRAALT